MRQKRGVAPRPYTADIRNFRRSSVANQFDLSRLSESVLRAFQDPEIEQHAKLIPTDPFLGDLPIVKSKNCDCWRADRLSRDCVRAETARPFAAVHRPMTQSTCHLILLGDEIVNGCRELGIHLENPFQGAPERFQSSDRL